MTPRRIRRIAILGALAGAAARLALADAFDAVATAKAETHLLHQVVVTNQPGGCSARGALWVHAGNKIRGYEQIWFDIDPGDSRLGSRWVSFDWGQKRLVTLVEDLNSTCGLVARDGILGQRVWASKQVGGLLGTGPAEGEGAFPGGHIIRAGRDLGAVGPGWAVAAFEEQYLGPLWLDDDPGWPDHKPKCAIALAHSPDQTQFALFGVLRESIRPLGISGGRSLAGFFVADGTLFYQNAAGRLMAKPLTNSAAPAAFTGAVDRAYMIRSSPAYREIYRGDQSVHGSNSRDPDIQFGLLADSGDLAKLTWPNDRRKVQLSGIVPHLLADAPGRPLSISRVDQWPRAWLWINRFPQNRKGQEDPLTNVVSRGFLQEGFLAFASQAALDVTPRLCVFRPPIGQFEDLVELSPCEGQRLTRVERLRVLPSGRIALIAAGANATVLQFYENPLMPTMTAQARAAQDYVFSAEPLPPVPVEAVTSLYAFAEHMDRGFDGMRQASDGKVYFGPMPHSPVKGAWIFQFDPARHEVSRLGVLDEISGNEGPGLVPNMMHTEPFEMNGRLYFSGQDPYYGQRYFPGWATNNPIHAGSPVVDFDLRTREFRFLGIPLPGRASIFKVTGGPVRNVLYLREGYYDGIWYQWPLDKAGMPAGQPEILPFERQPMSLHVGPEGRLYFPLPRSGTNGLDNATFGPPCDIWGYDPQSRRSERLATVDLKALNVARFPQHPKHPETIRSDCEFVDGDSGPDRILMHIPSVGLMLEFSCATRRIRSLGLWNPGAKVYPIGPADGVTTMKAARGRVFGFQRDRGTVRSGSFFGTRLNTMDVASGKVTVHGMLKDRHGRYIREVTQCAIGDDGDVYLGGTIYGSLDPRHLMQRNMDSLPIRLDSAFMVLAPGR